MYCCTYVLHRSSPTTALKELWVRKDVICNSSNKKVICLLLFDQYSYSGKRVKYGKKNVKRFVTKNWKLFNSITKWQMWRLKKLIHKQNRHIFQVNMLKIPFVPKNILQLVFYIWVYKLGFHFNMIIYFENIFKENEKYFFNLSPPTIYWWFRLFLPFLLWHNSQSCVIPLYGLRYML